MHSLRLLLARNFILTAIVPLLLIGFVAANLFTGKVRDELADRNQLLSSMLGSQVEQFLRQPETCLLQLAAVASHHLGNEPERISSLMAELLPLYPHLDSIHVLDEHGRVLFTAPENPDYIGIDLSRQPYFQATRAADGFFWSRVYLTPRSGRPSTTLSMRFAGGILVGQLNLEELNRYAAQITEDVEVTAILSEQDGTIIAHPDQDLVQGRHNLLDFDRYPDSQAGSEGFYTVPSTGEELYFCAKTLSGTGWNLMLVEPVRVLFDDERKATLLFWGSIIVTGGFAVWFALLSLQVVLRPIGRFTENVRAVAGGEYEEIPAADGYAELVDLQRSFSEMAATIAQRERELRLNEQRFRRFYEMDLVGMARISADGNYLALNAYLCLLVGMAQGELVGKPMWTCSYPEDGTREQDLLEQIRRSERDGYRLTRRIRRPDGFTRHAEVAVQAVRDDEGRLDHLVMIAGDLTWRVEAEEKLRMQRSRLEEMVAERTRELEHSHDLLKASEEQYTDLYEHAPDMYCSVEMETGTIVLCNLTMAEKLGCAKDGIIGRKIESFYHPACLDEARAALAEFAAQGAIQGKELQVRRPDGTSMEVSLSVTAVRDGQGRITHGRSCWVDITELKQAENRLRELAEALASSNRDLEQFAYIASHDLQEPLRMVSSYTQLLGDRYADELDDRARKYIGYAMDGAKRMQQLIHDLLAFSRVATKGKSPKPVHSGEALHSALDNLQIRIGETGAVIDHDGSLPWVFADKSQLIQLFQNLIGNAIKFRAAEPPEIRVRASCDRGYCHFLIRDNGIGIDDAYQEKVFTLFQRLHTRAEYSGTGIGLAVCKRIVERHGGRIWFTPAQERGTIFHFTLLEAPAPHKAGTGTPVDRQAA